MSNIVACICKQALVIRLYEGVRHIYIYIYSKDVISLYESALLLLTFLDT